MDTRKLFEKQIVEIEGIADFLITTAQVHRSFRTFIFHIRELSATVYVCDYENPAIALFVFRVEDDRGSQFCLHSTIYSKFLVNIVTHDRIYSITFTWSDHRVEYDHSLGIEWVPSAPVDIGS